MAATILPSIAGTMAATMKQMASIVAFFGVTSFMLGVVAENKKPAAGTPIASKGGVTCEFPADPTVVLGYLSVASLLVSTAVGYLSLFYSYKGKSIPQGVLFKSTSFMVFFNVALFTAGLAAAMLLLPTITEEIHLTQRFHSDPNYTCPTAKTGVIGGGAFLSLDSSLLWLVALMLAENVRADYFDEDGDGKDQYQYGKGAPRDFESVMVI